MRRGKEKAILEGTIPFNPNASILLAFPFRIGGILLPRESSFAGLLSFSLGRRGSVVVVVVVLVIIIVFL